MTTGATQDRFQSSPLTHNEKLGRHQVSLVEQRSFALAFSKPRGCGHIAWKSNRMRTSHPQMSMTLVPSPGTTEALELGCTCQFIAHDAATQEREPAGMLIDPDPNCPLHGTSRDEALRE
jgi:hypothetical protein